MSRPLATIVRRRPGLMMLCALYTAITVLVARSPLTVGLCTGLLVSIAVRFVLSARETRAGHGADVGEAP